MQGSDLITKMNGNMMDGNGNMGGGNMMMGSSVSYGEGQMNVHANPVMASLSPYAPANGGSPMRTTVNPMMVGGALTASAAKGAQRVDLGHVAVGINSHAQYALWLDVRRNPHCCCPIKLCRPMFGAVCTPKCAPQCYKFNDLISGELLHVRDRALDLAVSTLVFRFPRGASEQGYTQIQTKDECALAGSPEPVFVPVAGVLHPNVLYKMLPKEGRFVPARSWSMHMARSEILEFIKLLQLAGAVDVRFETVNAAPSGVAASVGGIFSGMSLGLGGASSKSGPAQILLAVMFLPFVLLYFIVTCKFLGKTEQKSSSSGAVFDTGGDGDGVAEAPGARSDTAPLGTTGRITSLPRNVVKLESSAQVIQLYGERNFWHLTQRPEWQYMVDTLLLGGGVTTGATFTLEHDGHDASSFDPLRVLNNLGVDTGYTSRGQRKMFTYVTVVMGAGGTAGALKAGWEGEQVARIPALNLALHGKDVAAMKQPKAAAGAATVVGAAPAPLVPAATGMAK